NGETNLLLKNNLSAFQYALNEYQAFWDDSSVPIDDRFLQAYLPRWVKAHELRVTATREMDKIFQAPAEPRPAQLAALQALAERRRQGISKTTVIAATGLGKTFLAAFDFRQSGLKRVLFIAHRENILLKARDAYRSILNAPAFGALLSGTAKPAAAD